MRDFYKLTDNFKTYSDVKSVMVIEGKIDTPDISIFIPTYKRTETLMVSVESAINQIGEHNYEIVIVNNDPEGISGDIKQLLEKYHNNRIYYYVNETNIGLCGNWNRGIELARGHYVTMIHDDDMLSPWFLTSIKKSITESNYPDIIGVSYVNFQTENMPTFEDPGELKYREVTKKTYFFGRYINIAGMTVNKKSILKLGGYADDYYPNEDSILIYQALINGRVVNIDNILAGYRQEANLSLSGDTMKKIIEKVEYTRQIIAEHEPFAARWMKMFDKEYLYRYVINANNHWGLTLDPYEIFDTVGLPPRQINRIRYGIMRGMLKILQARLGI